MDHDKFMQLVHASQKAIDEMQKMIEVEKTLLQPHWQDVTGECRADGNTLTHVLPGPAYINNLHTHDDYRLRKMRAWVAPEPSSGATTDLGNYQWVFIVEHKVEA